MTLSRLLCAGTLCVGLSVSAVKAETCPEINSFDGLIFDAGAFVASTGMEGYLDQALTYGVEKAVLYPHPFADDNNQPPALEESFPDLVVRGNAPWSDAAPVIWPEPITSNMISSFEAELVRNADQPYLLSHVSRFDAKVIKRWLGVHHNLWIGFSEPEVTQLVDSCAQGPLADLMRAAGNRVVFSSFGKDRGWKEYKWTIRKLKKLSTYLPAAQAEALLYKNAEELFKLSVTAP
ncbi:hypothetical protein [Terasakiella pusilla]|uniref:hypothetical protein n=1 Tax=Terasakiella pusilla TaxID=64973 RepID=UPI003AA865AC